MSHTHIPIWFLLYEANTWAVGVNFRIYVGLICKSVESLSFCVYYKYISFFFSSQFDILEIDVFGWLNMMKQIKQTQPVLNMENSGQWAYLKWLKVKHQNGFEGYLILTGARSQLTTLIKPQYIALHVSGNPRFQYYSKPEWYFLRCWRNVTYLFFTLFSSHRSSLLVYLEVTKSAPCSAAHNLTMWHKHDKKKNKKNSTRLVCFINHSRLNGIHF